MEKGSQYKAHLEIPLQILAIKSLASQIMKQEAEKHLQNYFQLYLLQKSRNITYMLLKFESQSQATSTSRSSNQCGGEILQLKTNFINKFFEKCVDSI
jgi:hypothetical protein